MIVRWFLVAEAAVFGSAALMHAGVLLQDHEHSGARNGESVIALVLLAGLLWSGLAPTRMRVIGLGAQGFALLGTLLGLSMIAIGIGPQSALDLILHATMVALLVAGLVVTSRATYAV